MLKILISLVFLYSFSFANLYSKNYLKNIRKQNPITYETLINHYMYYLDGFDNGEPTSEIESDFVNSFDKNEIAIYIPKIKAKDLIVATKNYAIGIYNYDNFSVYGVIFSPDGVVKKVLLLMYSFGNINFHIQRDYHLKISKRVEFFITEKREDRDESDNNFKLSYKHLYLLRLDKNSLSPFVKVRI